MSFVFRGVPIVEDSVCPPLPPTRGVLTARYDCDVNIFAFVISLVLFVAGFYVMGSAFYVTGLESVVFFAGLIVSSIGLFIPIHILKRIDG